MFSIRQDQLDAIRSQRVQAFSRHLADRARDLHTDSVADSDDETLLRDMETVIEAARARGLKTQSQMERFADLSVLLGVGFETSEAWAQAIFDDDALHPLERLHNAEATAVFIIREQ